MNAISVKLKVIGNRSRQFACLLVFLNIALLCTTVYAGRDDKSPYERNDSLVSKQAVAEKKVDYLEQIYFSGGDKDSLKLQIDIALQNIQEQLPTKSLAKQATFLIDIQENAEQASNACDILDILAVGIYKIDPSEASQQGVRMPTDKAKKKSVDAIGALDKLNTSAYNLSNTANGAAWETYMLSGGKYGGFVAGASKIGNAASKVGNTVKVVGGVVKTGKDVKDLGEKLGIRFGKKDKPCNDVTPKTIVIGEHIETPDVSKVINVNTSATTTAPIVAGSAKQEATPSVKTVQSKITINAVSQAQLQSILSSITKIPGVKSAESDSYSKNIAVLVVDGNLKIGELANKIVDACKPLKLTIDSYSNASNSADLILKP